MNDKDEVSIANYENEQHYVIQDKKSGMTYAVYVVSGGMIGSVTMVLTAHVDKVYNMGRMVSYARNTIMYNLLYDMISKAIGG